MQHHCDCCVGCMGRMAGWSVLFVFVVFVCTSFVWQMLSEFEQGGAQSPTCGRRFLEQNLVFETVGEEDPVFAQAFEEQWQSSECADFLERCQWWGASL